MLLPYIDMLFITWMNKLLKNMWGHCLGFRKTLTLGFSARMDPSLACLSNKLNRLIPTSYEALVTWKFGIFQDIDKCSISYFKRDIDIVIDNVMIRIGNQLGISNIRRSMWTRLNCAQVYLGSYVPKSLWLQITVLTGNLRSFRQHLSRQPSLNNDVTLSLLPVCIHKSNLLLFLRSIIITTLLDLSICTSHVAKTKIRWKLNLQWLWIWCIVWQQLTWSYVQKTRYNANGGPVTIQGL